MEEDIFIYLILTILSVCIFYALSKWKCILLSKKKKELEYQNKTAERLVSIFYKILNNGKK